jgi:hypothetical protein
MVLRAARRPSGRNSDTLMVRGPPEYAWYQTPRVMQALLVARASGGSSSTSADAGAAVARRPAMTRIGR